LVVACIHEWLRRGQRVLYFTEESEPLWWQRLCKHAGPWRGLQLVFALGTPPADLLARMVSAEQEIVVVDTLRNLGILGPDENDNAAIARAIAPWVSSARRGSKTWIGLHHSRKGGGENGEGIAGGHALMGAVDVALEVTRDRNDRRRLVKGQARIIQIKELLFEQGDDGEIRSLGEAAGVNLMAVRARIQTTLGKDWLKTSEILDRLDEPKPSDELLRQALTMEAKAGRVERCPPMFEGKVKGKTIRWRATRYAGVCLWK